jgi:beta-phosphoglucomutase-like phosphatase (HAD superfamily)
MLSVEHGLPEGLHNFINEIKQIYTSEYIYLKCKPVFIHQYALSKLKNTGYKLAVCSNAVRNSVTVMMSKSALDEYLEFFISNEDVTNPKPDPEMYNTAIARLSCTPDECLILEDNENGLKAARDSGAHVMKIDSINEVTYDNIINEINKIEEV